MIRISQVKVDLNYQKRPLVELAARLLKLRPEDVVSARIFRKSIDARDKADVHFVLTLDVDVERMPARLPKNAEILKDDAPEAPVMPAPETRHRPIVAGMGPAGLFAALKLAQAGMRPLVIERGRDVDARARDVEAFWSGGKFDPRSNVQFGEGGAGTFSDGKLNSGIKDARCRQVLKTFCRMGAPEEILYQAKPHIGTDHLRAVVRNLRNEIIRLGGEVRFEAKLDGIEFGDGRLAAAFIDGERIEADQLILAIGHSARDTFEMLNDAGVFMEQKPFSIGARIEHKQRMVNRAQYGACADHPALGAADYKLSIHLPDGRAAYTFCMCPGGQVVAAASEEGGVAVNGMSLFARDGENANSALLVSVGPGDYGGDDPLAGVRFQRKWEEAAFRAGGGDYRAPAQLCGDFLADRATPAEKGEAAANGEAGSQGAKSVRPSYRPGVKWTNLASCLPEYVAQDMRQAILAFDRKLHGFADPNAVLTGVETRSSSPVRILRGQDFSSVTVHGLYPCGEGAGYAGGILSAAVDGLKCAEALIHDAEEYI